MSNYFKAVASIEFFPQIDDYFFKDRASDLVNRFYATSAVCLEQAQSCHHEPSRHLPLIFIAQVSIVYFITVIAVNNGSAPFLGLPRLAYPVEQEREVHGLLISLYDGVIPVLIARGVVS